MKSRNVLIAILALFLAAAAVLAWREHEELAVLRARLLVLGDERSDLLDRLARLENRNKALQDQFAARKASRAGQTAADLGGEERPAGRPRDWRGGFRAAMNNPEFMKLMAIEQKTGLNGRYAALFKSLTQNFNLTPDQLDQLKNLLVQKQQAVMDALQAARDQGINPRSDPDAFSQAVAAAQASVEQQIAAALGAAAYAQYQQYEQTLPQRNTVTAVQQALSYTSVPLTDQQSDQLIQILAQDQPQESGPGNGLRGLFNNNPTATITAQAMTDAAAILTPSQLQALQQVQQSQQARQQMQQLLRSSGGGPRG